MVGESMMGPAAVERLAHLRRGQKRESLLSPASQSRAAQYLPPSVSMRLFEGPPGGRCSSTDLRVAGGLAHQQCANGSALIAARRVHFSENSAPCCVGVGLACSRRGVRLEEGRRRAHWSCALRILCCGREPSSLAPSILELYKPSSRTAEPGTVSVQAKEPRTFLPSVSCRP
jgi:hypothetical protein